MLAKFRSYRPSHPTVVAYLALFVALGGTSHAAVKITGKNVPKDALTGADIKKLTGKDVTNNSLTGADVKNLGSGDVSNGRLRAEDFAPGQLPRGEPGAPGEPATRLWAVVNADATTPAIRRQSGAVGLERGSAGGYRVRFNRSVSNCAQSAVVAENLGSGDFERHIIACTAGDSPGNVDADEVFVGTSDTATTLKDTDFSVQVFC